MTAVNCPMCELRFATRNERDWHLRTEHEHLHHHPPADRPVEWPHRPAESHDERRPDTDTDTDTGAGAGHQEAAGH